MRDVVAREKRYVTVISVSDANGVVTPREIIWDDGRRFAVDRVLDCRQAASLRAGGCGLRYTVRVGGEARYLYYEDPRWFVEAMVVPMPGA